MFEVAIKIYAKARGKSRVGARVVVRLTARRKPRYSSRKRLGDGGWLINRYYRRDERGILIPADIESATHCERSVYDPFGNMIGTSIGPLTGGF